MELGPYRAVDHPFRLTVDGVAPVDVRSIFAGLEDPHAQPRLRFRLTFDQPDGRGTLHDGDELVTSGPARVLLQGVISCLGETLTVGNSAVAVHATTVGDERGGTLLVGRSWAGKSTLATALMVDGLRLVAEDITIFDDDLRARPYHRPLGLTEASFDLLGLEVPDGADDHCGGAKMLVSAEQLGLGVQGATPIRIVALCDRTSDALQRISPALALARVLEMGVAPLPDPGHHLDVLARVLTQAVCVEVGTRSLKSATEWLHTIESPTAAPPATLVEVHGNRADVYCGDEAVIVQLDDLRAHHLNRPAAAVWLLHTEGLGPAAIAGELGADPGSVDETFAEFAHAGLL